MAETTGLDIDSIEFMHFIYTISFSFCQYHFLIFTEKSFYPKTMSAINVETTEQDALYVINEEDILTDTDTLADSNLNYDYWYLIVILPTNLKIYQTKAYEETVVSQ